MECDKCDTGHMPSLPWRNCLVSNFCGVFYSIEYRGCPPMKASGLQGTPAELPGQQLCGVTHSIGWLTAYLIKTPREDVRCANILGWCLAVILLQDASRPSQQPRALPTSWLRPMAPILNHHPSLGLCTVLCCCIGLKSRDSNFSLFLITLVYL